MSGQGTHRTGPLEGSRAGGFVLGKLVRRGPLTSVHLARAEGDDEERYVARVVHVRRSADAEQAGRLLEEFEALKELRHPSIPRLVAAHVVSAGPVVVTDRVEGRTLRVLRARGLRLDPAMVARAVTDVAGALDAMHERSPPMVHRAVSPENVLVDESGRAWLEECGLAHCLVEAGWVPAVVSPNAPEYLSPDELRHRVTARSDVFALATVAFECLTGRAPFAGDTEAERAVAILVGPRPSASALRPGLPREVDVALARAWAADEGDAPERYAGAGELAAELRRALELMPQNDASDDVDRAFDAIAASAPSELDTSENPTLRLRALPSGSVRPPPLPSSQATLPGTFAVGARLREPSPEGAKTPDESGPVPLRALTPTLTPAPMDAPPAPFDADPEAADDRPTLAALTPTVRPPPVAEVEAQDITPAPEAPPDETPPPAEIVPAPPPSTTRPMREHTPARPLAAEMVRRPSSMAPVSSAAPAPPPAEPVQLQVATRIAKILGVSIVAAAAIVAASRVYTVRLEHETAALTANRPPTPGVAAEPDAGPRPAPPAPEAPTPSPPPPLGTPRTEPTPTSPQDAGAAATPDAATAAAVDAGLPPRPAAADVQRVQARLQPAVAGCVARNDVGPVVRVVVTYAGRSGRATHVGIPGAANEEPMGSCIEGAVLRAPMPPFGSATWQATFSFPVRR